MRGLRNKDEIENYDLKAKVLEENGWTTYYHDDNWVKIEWFNDPTIRIDWSGINTDTAYYQYSPEKEQEDLEILNNIHKFEEELKKLPKNITKDTDPIEID